MSERIGPNTEHGLRRTSRDSPKAALGALNAPNAALGESQTRRTL